MNSSHSSEGCGPIMFGALAVLTLLVSILAWLSPFNPTGPSPLEGRHPAKEQPSASASKSHNRMPAERLEPEIRQPAPRSGEEYEYEQPNVGPSGEPLSEAAPPKTLEPSGELGRIILLRDGSTHQLAHLNTVISATFRETLGSQYVEMLVTPLDGAPVRFPARSAGASGSFSVAHAHYSVQIVSIDWQELTIRVVINNAVAS